MYQKLTGECIVSVVFDYVSYMCVCVVGGGGGSV